MVRQDHRKLDQSQSWSQILWGFSRGVGLHIEEVGPHKGRWCPKDPEMKTRVSLGLRDSMVLVEGVGPHVGRWCAKDLPESRNLKEVGPYTKGMVSGQQSQDTRALQVAKLLTMREEGGGILLQNKCGPQGHSPHFHFQLRETPGRLSNREHSDFGWGGGPQSVEQRRRGEVARTLTSFKACESSLPTSSLHTPESSCLELQSNDATCLKFPRLRNRILPPPPPPAPPLFLSLSPPPLPLAILCFKLPGGGGGEEEEEEVHAAAGTPSSTRSSPSACAPATVFAPAAPLSQSSSQEEEGPSTSRALPDSESLPRNVIGDKVADLVGFLLLKYRTKKLTTKVEMLSSIIREHQDHFAVIFSEASECMQLVYGIDVKGVDPTSHTYVLVTNLGLTYDGMVSNEHSMPKTGLLILILSIIFSEDDCVPEEKIWEALNAMGVHAGMEHCIYGEPRELLTKVWVQEQYLEYQQVRNSQQAWYEFLLHAETSKLKVLEFLAHINGSDPRSFPHWYEEALREEEQRAQARISTTHDTTVMVSASSSAMSSSFFCPQEHIAATFPQKALRPLGPFHNLRSSFHELKPSPLTKALSFLSALRQT
ncbi:hypothetical protein QTO34_000592 [Cnephaeus nilssonii]|uniref:MAGE domain-containing protein n=1 Tax=Cnephaeus nilssonii TaxID=3371016 RepID=A0AA40IBN2_CNENI|nr:hypothetical protein QTO34_000592 [Eptesicus nilssonii]